jgi:hypothetical protein
MCVRRTRTAKSMCRVVTRVEAVGLYGLVRAVKSGYLVSDVRREACDRSSEWRIQTSS